MKKIAFFLCWFLLSCPLIAKANTATLNEEYLKGVYYVMTSPDGKTLKHQQAIFRLDGKIAYCLDPEIAAKAGEYRVTEGLSGSYLSKENRDKVETFGYYGYEYPNHQTINYYLAAQELIWETVSDYQVKWTTTLEGLTDINVEKEKEEILKLIYENQTLPSFHGKTIFLYEEEYLELYDENKVLESFQFNTADFHFENGYLVGQGSAKDITLKGTKKTYDNEVTLLYRQDESQKMATLRLTNPSMFQISIAIEGVSINIHKTGELWNGIWNSGEWKNQNGVEFELYAEEDIIGHFGNILYGKDELIERLTTKNGYASSRKLPDGTYKLVETKGKEGYHVIDPIIFEINSSVEKNPVIEVQNQLSTGSIEIKKVDQNGNPLKGVTFGLYSKGGRKLDEQVTDESGKIIWKRLPVGEYQIKELAALDGFILDSRKEKVTLKEDETLVLNKVNVPLLPNTSGKRGKTHLLIGILGIFISKHFLC